MVEQEIKVGTELEVSIGTVGSKGDGIAKHGEFVIFVPETSEGDKVKIKISKVIDKVAFGEVEGKTQRVEEEDNSDPDEILKDLEDSE